MAKDGKIGLTIERKTWKELVKIKINRDLKTLNEVIIFLLDKNDRK